MGRLTAATSAVLGSAVLVLGAAGGGAGSAAAAPLTPTAAAQRADGVVFFSNPGKTVVCRYSSFSGYQELKCQDKLVAGDDGGPFTARLRATGAGSELIFDSNPVEKAGSVLRRFAKAPFTCTLAKTAVRCTNPQKHGFLLTGRKDSVF